MCIYSLFLFSFFVPKIYHGNLKKLLLKFNIVKNIYLSFYFNKQISKIFLKKFFTMRFKKKSLSLKHSEKDQFYFCQK